MAKPNPTKKENRKKWKVQHPDGRIKFTSKKVLKRLTKKQDRNVKRGRKGHNPRPRKLI
jgi:hypothetical protein